MATLIRGSFIILVLLLALHCKKVMCRPEIDEFDACNTSYTSLAKALLDDDRNFYTMQSTFFPPISTSPVFIAVTYVYNNSVNNNRTFFWSSAVYFFFHPVRIFQFTSLLFSDPSLRYNETTLYLPEDCRGTSDDFMLLLTQRVSQVLFGYYYFNC